MKQFLQDKKFVNKCLRSLQEQYIYIFKHTEADHLLQLNLGGFGESLKLKLYDKYCVWVAQIMDLPNPLIKKEKNPIINM